MLTSNKQLGGSVALALQAKRYFARRAVFSPTGTRCRVEAKRRWTERLLLWGEKPQVDYTQPCLVSPVLWMFGFSKHSSFLSLNPLIVSPLNRLFSSSSIQISQPLLREAAKLTLESAGVTFPMEGTSPLWGCTENSMKANDLQR